MAKRAKKKAGWSAKLTRSLILKDGRKLVTLADARAIPITYFETATQSPAVAHAIALLLEASASGKFTDRKAATTAA